MPLAKRILFETIVSSLDDARAAAAGGADRFELCSALALGGLTPSLGTLAAITDELSLPVMFMLRPREGGMAYTRADGLVMARDGVFALEHGARGLVFGFLTPEGEVDIEACRQLLMDTAPQAGTQLVFHRAFDVVRDPHRALEQLIDLGITRVLTSGRAPTVMEGLNEIRRTVEQADGRIEVLPGGGIRAEDVREVVARTGVDQVHLSVSAIAPDTSVLANPAIRFGAHAPPAENEFRAVDEGLVRRVRELLDSCS